MRDPQPRYAGADYMPPMTTKAYGVCLFNSADPRGSKVGGIETYTRDYIHYHPNDMDLLFVGVDEVGDLKIGEINEVAFRGRTFKFLPLYFLDDSAIVYPDRITNSDTYKFAKALLHHFSMLRQILKKGNYTAEIRRVEYAPILWAMGVPFIQMVHIWGDRNKPMSSLLGRYWYVRDLTEYVAALLCEKFYSVNSDMTAMYKRRFKRLAYKFDTLTTWANTSIFKPVPYVMEGTIRIMYAGRTDKFKRLDIICRVIAQASRLNGGNVEFHYAGDGDLNQFPEFATIKDITVLHGRKNAQQVAEIIQRTNVGVLCSEFEGMPRVVLESLTSGRPVVALHLPQLESVIIDGASGYLIARTDDAISIQAQRLLDIYKSMAAGNVTPVSVAEAVHAFRPEVLLGKIHQDHRQLRGSGKETTNPAVFA